MSTTILQKERIGGTSSLALLAAALAAFVAICFKRRVAIYMDQRFIKFRKQMNPPELKS